MGWIVRIKSSSFPGKSCYLYRDSRGNIRRHLNIAHLFETRAAAIMAIELLRRDIKMKIVENAGNLDMRLRYAEVVQHEQVEGESMIFFN